MPQSSISSVFLGWDRPCLEQASRWLIEQSTSENGADLSSFCIVVPGSRAGRRLLEILVSQSESLGLSLQPPRIVTSGVLPELVLEAPEFPYAGNLERLSAWAQALQSFEAPTLAQLLPNLPQAQDTLSWIELAHTIEGLYRELSGAGLSFAEVAEKGQELEFFNEQERWQILEEIKSRFLEILREGKRADLHFERARGLEEERFISCAKIVLISTIDLTSVARRLLKNCGAQVFALVHAPKSEAEGFDPFGCVLDEYWQNRPICISDAILHVTENPEEQALAAVDFIASLQAKFPAEEISVGSGSEELIPWLAQALGHAELPYRTAAGAAFLESAPGALLQAIERYLRSSRFRDFSTLLRHPDFASYLERSGLRSGVTKAQSAKMLFEFDRYHTDHLQTVVSQKLPGLSANTKALNIHVVNFLQLLAEFKKGPRQLAQWTDPITELLREIYAEEEFSRFSPRGRQIIEAFELLNFSLLELCSFSDELSIECSGADAIGLILRELSAQTIKPEPEHEAIEILGWLELQLDDAPVLVIAGFNEGSIPESVNSDPFLPDALRRLLGILDNSRRYARDAFALSAILASRQKLSIIMTRRNSQGDPLVASRLLFACEDETAAKRVSMFYQDSETTRHVRSDLEPAKLAFSLPSKPIPLNKPVPYLTITSFKTYLQCPYRFYLKHIRRLESLDDQDVEMPPSVFGDVMHMVLARFGQGECKDETDANTIFDYLSASLSLIFDERFSSSVIPIVKVQREILELKLRKFSRWQAQWRADGWKISQVEMEFSPQDCTLPLVDGPIGLKGRIDRLDYNEARSEWAVLDYKVGDKLSDPQSAHSSRDGWRDLQLPAYYHLLRQSGYKGKVFLGYITIPSEIERTGHKLVDWTDDELEEAYQLMLNVAEKVRAQVFWPPRRVSNFDEFAELCGTSLLQEFEAEDAEVPE